MRTFPVVVLRKLVAAYLFLSNSLRRTSSNDFSACDSLVA
jgi:hypothetical protein